MSAVLYNLADWQLAFLVAVLSFRRIPVLGFNGECLIIVKLEHAGEKKNSHFKILRNVRTFLLAKRAIVRFHCCHLDKV